MRNFLKIFCLGIVVFIFVATSASAENSEQSLREELLREQIRHTQLLRQREELLLARDMRRLEQEKQKPAPESSPPNKQAYADVQPSAGQGAQDKYYQDQSEAEEPSPVHATQENDGISYYAGFDLQMHDIDYANAVFDAMLKNTLNGGNGHIGVRFNRYLGAELGYFGTETGRRDLNLDISAVTGIPGDVLSSTDIKAQGITLDALAICPCMKDLT